MATEPYVLVPRTPSAIVEDQLKRLFKRCVQCPQQLPACNCAPGQTCSLSIATCDNCAFTTCSGAATTSGPSPGAIAGGVIGGVIVLSAIVFMAWWFRRKRRPEEEYAEEEYYDPQEWDEMQMQEEKEARDRYSQRMKSRQSTQTVGSVASSHGTGRASNIIQIAYIPGVTNRSQSTPDLIPPVPPIPAASGGSSRASQADQLLFLPGDLGRQSTYSEYSTRSSVAGRSRNSVASTAYREDAIVNPLPAQAVNLLRPAAVSVKSSTKNSPNLSRHGSPPPGLESPSGNAPQLNTKSSIVGKFAQPRAITVTRKNSHSLKPHGAHTFELDASDVSSLGTSYHHGHSGPGSPKSGPASTFEYADSSDEAEHSRAVELPASKTPTTPNKPASVYSRGAPAELADSRTSVVTTPKAIQEAMLKAMQTNMGPVPETSPFSDENRAATP